MGLSVKYILKHLYFTGKRIYKEDLKTSYNWPDDDAFRSLNNGKEDIANAPRATKADFIKIFNYIMQKYENVRNHI